MNVVDAGNLCSLFTIVLISVGSVKDKLKHLASASIMALLLKCEVMWSKYYRAVSGSIHCV